MTAADGYFERVAWAGPNDGMLVLDLAHSIAFDANGNLTAASYIGDGIIDYAEEISFWASNPSVDTDLKAIADLFDSNHNHQLDAGDARWSSFKVWKDTNQDGKTDAGELVTLASGRRCLFGRHAVGLLVEARRGASKIAVIMRQSAPAIDLIVIT